MAFSKPGPISCRRSFNDVNREPYYNLPWLPLPCVGSKETVTPRRRPSRLMRRSNSCPFTMLQNRTVLCQIEADRTGESWIGCDDFRDLPLSGEGAEPGAVAARRAGAGQVPAAGPALCDRAALDEVRSGAAGVAVENAFRHADARRKAGRAANPVR